MPSAPTAVPAAAATAALGPAVAADLDAVLREAFGGGVRVASTEPLASRLSPVWRVRLSGARGGRETVIVKHLAEDWYGDPAGDVPREFAEEAAVYRLFDALPPPGFADRAARIAAHPRGLLVLEDLGPGRWGPLPREATELAVDALARLHAATHGRGALLRAVRAEMGLDDGRADDRYDGERAVARHFARGATMLRGWCQALSVAEPPDLDAELEAVRRAMMSPGVFAALVHDDLAAARQCIVRAGRIHLLDWENAKFAHCLRDVAKVLVGKFEFRHDTGELVAVRADADASLADRYRRVLARAGGPDVGDAAWDDALSAAVLFSTVVQVGVLVGHAGGAPVAGGLPANVRTLLRRADELLGGRGGRADVRRMLRGVEGRIV